MSDLAKSLSNLLNVETRTGLLFLTGAWILVLSLVFFAAFVYQLAWVKEAATQLDLAEWVYGLLLVLAVHALVVLLSATDVLTYGNPKRNKFAAAFQRRLPSTHLSKVIEVDSDVGTRLWFDEFNKWADPEHPRCQDRNRTFQRGYACRFVYYLTSVSRSLFLLGLAWLGVELILEWVFGTEVVAVEAKAVSLAVFFMVWLIVRLTNRVRESQPTGVWRRFDEINQRHCDWIDSNAERLSQPTDNNAAP
jgi:hypothetical protein